MPASGRVIPSESGVAHLSGALLTVGYALMVTAGIFGFVDSPSNSVVNILGYSLASLAWNAALVVSGLIGVYSRFAKMPRIEVVAVETLAVIVWLWAGFVLLSPELSDQSAFVLLAVGALMFGWAAGTRRYLDTRTRVLDGGDPKGRT